MTHSTLHRPAVFPTKRSWMLALVSLAATRCCTAFTALPFRRTSSFRPDQSWATTAFRPPRCFSSRRNSSDTKDSLVSSSSSEAESVVLSNNNTTTTTRQEALHSQLAQIGIDPGQLQQAAVQSIQNPIQGYDGRYGKSAIKTYRSFIRPKTNQQPSGDLIATAFRTAQQISFLQKRHESHQTEWIRHQDDPAASSSQNNPSKTTRRRTFPIILLLDNVRSALNVGSLFRTADAAGCAQVWVSAASLFLQERKSRQSVSTADDQPSLFVLYHTDGRNHASSPWQRGGETAEIRIGRRNHCTPLSFFICTRSYRFYSKRLGSVSDYWNGNHE